MSSLNELLTGVGVRKQVVADCERVIEEEVGSKGLMGLPIKAAFAVVKAVKPGFVPEVIDHMLDDFSKRLDPLYQESISKGEPVAGYFNARPAQVADALLAITDERAGRAKNPTLKSAYGKLRPAGKKHVEAAVPRIGRLVAKYSAMGSAMAPAPSPSTGASS